MSRKPIPIKVVNLEDGRPTVEQARLRLGHELHQAAREGCRALKLIHGYGSSGVGGELRLRIQATLRRMVADGKLAAMVPGEDWRIADETTWSLLQRFPEWKRDSDLGRGNKGVCIVVL
jgi:hypothetical protein